MMKVEAIDKLYVKLFIIPFLLSVARHGHEMSFKASKKIAEVLHKTINDVNCTNTINGVLKD